MSRGRPEIVTAEELIARALELSQVPPAEHDQSDQTELVVMQLAGEYFGAAVHLVREVVANPVITAMPMAPPVVAGIINLRGDILTVLNLNDVLNLPSSDCSGRLALVVHDAGVRAALLVDSVEGVEWYPSTPEPVIATVPAEHARFLTGVYRSTARLVTEINITAVLTHPQLQAAASRQA